MSTDPSTVTAWPPVSIERLSESVVALADRVAEADVRAQLHALGAILANLGAERTGQPERERLIGEYARDAVRGGPQALEVLRRLAALDRSAVMPVDWSAASGSGD